MPDVRERLMDLLTEATRKWGCQIGLYGCMADRMIANGVTFETDTNVGSKWIPVTERKPEEFVSVLIYAPGLAPMPTVMEAYWARACWVTRVMILQEHEVTHWMEMPEPPGDCHGLRPRNDGEVAGDG